MQGNPGSWTPILAGLYEGFIDIIYRVDIRAPDFSKLSPKAYDHPEVDRIWVIKECILGC